LFKTIIFYKLKL